MQLRSLLFTLIFVCVSSIAAVTAQTSQTIPSVYSNLHEENGRFFIELNDQRVFEDTTGPVYTLDQLIGAPRGTETGLAFNFGDDLDGKLYFGFIPYGDSKHPMPVYFSRYSMIEDGYAVIEIGTWMRGIYDMIGWQKHGKGTIGYRVINEDGLMLYDGIISFKGKGPFEVDDTVIEGPFINLLSPQGATISFTTNHPIKASVSINGKTFTDRLSTQMHEIQVTGLRPATEYDYTVYYGDNKQSYSFRTAPDKGSSKPFTFAYASDSRSGRGGGERDIHGANSYMIKRILAVCKQKRTAFMQFTGDLINGYLTSPEQTDLQYANWKRAVQPFWHYFPVYAGMGNHEALVRSFPVSGGNLRMRIDRFPFDEESAEAVFARNFVNPLNGPDSEDGNLHDPNPDQVDFPSYKENVYSYTYGNVAMIVLNSDYFYAPSTSTLRTTSGGMHGYIMVEQLAWLSSTLDAFENDKDIDHVFVTQHTPSFPNGGHVRDDMWYNGNNHMRPYIAGKAARKGIIERRDQYLDLLVNKSRKVRAILTGDEHNYCRLKLTPDTEIYPDLYLPQKISLSRTIYQINNGAAGAPYYGQETTPWTPYVSGFTTQNAVVLFHVEKKKIIVEVINPDTLEVVDKFRLN
jgi:hypothetical protein